jgi:hypothetical protein
MELESLRQNLGERRARGLVQHLQDLSDAIIINKNKQIQYHTTEHYNHKQNAIWFKESMQSIVE